MTLNIGTKVQFNNFHDETEAVCGVAIKTRLIKLETAHGFARVVHILSLSIKYLIILVNYKYG